MPGGERLFSRARLHEPGRLALLRRPPAVRRRRLRRAGGDPRLRAKLDAEGDQPAMLNVFGGKPTTYRKLAETAIAMLAPHLPKPARPGAWTAKASLPGGDFPVRDSRRSSRTCKRATALSIRLHSPARTRLRDPRSRDSEGRALGRRSRAKLRGGIDRSRTRLSRRKRMGHDGGGCRLAPIETRAAALQGRDRRHQLVPEGCETARRAAVSGETGDVCARPYRVRCRRRSRDRRRIA